MLCIKHMFAPQQYARHRSGHGTEPGQVAVVVEHVLTALRLGCTLPLVQFTLGNAYSEQADYDGAILAYRTALDWNNHEYLEPGTKQVTLFLKTIRNESMIRD